MKQYDVVVIGAGLAGLQCARLLVKQGLRVLLVNGATHLKCFAKQEGC
ncbi:MAG TPA: FAD-dependent oxidoreductase [Pyrinomonadaceae bacterium]|nr:FAD-dependent oxidoreductase [Pyrinomonadaceae bacterium]